MTIRSLIARAARHQGLNFVLTNRVPRRSATRLIGWLSKIEQPLVRDLSIAVWRVFTDLDLGEAKKKKFKSMHDCFTRELKEGARPADPDPNVLVSPCDGIVGANGALLGSELMQVKGFRYTLEELLGDSALVNCYRNGRYVTLRLTSSMYHRFHAPHDCRIEQVIYIAGDTWNVNPVALKRVERLFCKNERAVVQTVLTADGQPVTLVAVAAILVASIRMHCLHAPLNLQHRGPNVLPCDAAYRKGDELGWFEHGSTIIVFTPEGFALCDGVREGARVRVGEPLMRLP